MTLKILEMLKIQKCCCKNILTFTETFHCYNVLTFTAALYTKLINDERWTRGKYDLSTKYVGTSVDICSIIRLIKFQDFQNLADEWAITSDSITAIFFMNIIGFRITSIYFFK